MYERLARLSDGIRWVGCNSAFTEQVDIDFSGASYGSRYHDNFWVTDVLERMGLPFYFAEGEAVASFLEGDAVKDMTDGQIEAILKGSVFCDGESAAALISRGYGDRLGVYVSDWDLGVVSGEAFDKDGVYTILAWA